MAFSLMKRFDVSVLMTDELRAFLQGAHPDPFRILGPHRLRDDVLVRVFRPDAREISIKLNHRLFPRKKSRVKAFSKPRSRNARVMFHTL
jgi:hypothetical protein